MIWNKDVLNIEGTEVECQAPSILSVSRRTDIPAFHMKSFINNMKLGYCLVTNPYNQSKTPISLRKVKFIVFWSKNPMPLIEYIPFFMDNGIDFYIQFTLNNYEKELLEKNVPPLKERIETFKTLSNILGKGRVIWRFDPLILGENLSTTKLLDKIEFIGNEIEKFNEQLIFSFVDIYKKVDLNFKSINFNYKNWTEPLMTKFAVELVKLNRKFKFKLSTCCESIDFAKYNISHSRCIDPELIYRFSNDKEFLKSLGIQKNFLGKISYPDLKDKNQRHNCGCMISKDIGEYNTCSHNCVYCYAK